MNNHQAIKSEMDAQEKHIRELERRLAETEVNLQAVISQQIDAVLTSENTVPLLLQQAQAALQRSNEELELRVAERTAELQQANASLQRELDERKRAEQALRESEAREHNRAKELETLMDAVPAMIWISRDRECHQMFGNRLGYEYLQMRSGANISKSASQEEVIAQPYRWEKGGVPISAEKLPMQMAAATGKSSQDFTAELVFDDGTVRHLLGNVNPLFDTDGNSNGAIGAFVDITELRKLQKQQMEYLTQIAVQHRLIEEREQDRLTIARNIHDGPVQNLTSMLFNVQVMKDEFPDARLREELDGFVKNLKNTLQELRHLIFEIRPPSVIRFGLARAIKFHAGELKEIDTGVRLLLDLAEDGPVLGEFTCLALYRIYQEAITNVLRHSKAQTAWVRMDFVDENLALEIEDNGQGFDFSGNVGRLVEGGHYGLAGMQERAEVIGGSLTVSSEPGKGTKIRVITPVLGRNK